MSDVLTITCGLGRSSCNAVEGVGTNTGASKRDAIHWKSIYSETVTTVFAPRRMVACFKWRAMKQNYAKEARPMSEMMIATSVAMDLIVSRKKTPVDVGEGKTKMAKRFPDMMCCNYGSISADDDLCRFKTKCIPCEGIICLIASTKHAYSAACSPAA